ncbi:MULTISPECIES: DUF1653 domain-containing protein [Rheinheimera]|uniref:DUF1653 domain-containing protein n=1 Tax=Rheinheimera marina TaxID=1774958 RepID=A0ABV9JK02_9GAMM
MTKTVAATAQLRAGLYQHYKGPYYQLIDTVRHSETDELLVLYRALYGDFGLWVRPVTMFTEQVQTETGLKPRFAFVSATVPAVLSPQAS